MSDRDQRVKDLVSVSAFLVWCPPDTYWGAVRAIDAFEAFARLVGIPADDLRNAITHPQEHSCVEEDQ